MIDLDALEKLAKNAGSDEWYFLQACTPHSVQGGEFVGDEPLPYGDVYSVATYETPEGREQLLIASEIGVVYGSLMAAANPAVILNLIGIARAAADSLPKIKEGDRYEALERKHLGDIDKGTGIYASRLAPASQAAAPTTGPQEVLRLSGYQLAEALNMAWPDRADHDQGETEIGFWIRSKAETIDGDECPAGVYGFWADYPEEGSVLVDGSQFENAVCLAGAAPVEAAENECWTANTGDEPLFLVDLEFRDGSIEHRVSAGHYHWHLDGKDRDIVRWRQAAPAPEAQ